jgi:hypothetical protein
LSVCRLSSRRNDRECNLDDVDRVWRLRRWSLRSALGERLEPVGDDLDGASSAAIGGLPLTALEPTLDVDEAAFAEVGRGEVSELTPEDHVVELGVALAVGRDTDGRNVLAGCGLPQCGSGDKAPDDGYLVYRVSPRLALVCGDGLCVFGCVAAGFLSRSGSGSCPMRVVRRFPWRGTYG